MLTSLFSSTIVSGQRTHHSGIRSGAPALWTVKLASLCLIVGVWFLTAQGLADEQTLPGPSAVLAIMQAELASGELVNHLSVTLLRVLAAFAIAMTIGFCAGMIMGRSKEADGWLDTLLVIMLNLPALVTIVLCYVWIGLTEVAAILAVAMNKIPMVTMIIREGARSLDPQLDDMAAIYKPSRRIILRHILLPQLAPHLASAGRTGIALIWKIVLVVELLGRSNGVGFQIHLGFQMFDVGLILAYSLSFIVVMLLIEAFILQPWERYANRWRFQ